MAILVAYDGSYPARRAVEYAVREYPDEELVLLRVIEAADGSTGAGIGLAKEKLKELRKDVERRGYDAVEEFVDTADVDVRVETAVGNPARKIVDFAEEHDVDHVIVGNHGRSGVSRVLLGSVAEKVVRRVPVPVTVVR